MALSAASVENELLNIKQAAKFLNVSEVSLRRWTDSGKLSCLRVGARRERRFLRHDLFAFLESQPVGTTAPDGKGAQESTAHIFLEGMAIDYGKHLCSLYESDLGRIKLATPFLAGGLNDGDICFLIAAPDAQHEILHHVGEVYGELDRAVDEGRLIVSNGMASGPEMHEFFERNFVMATRGGHQSLRVLGDMGWALDMGVGLDELKEFEMRYNHTLARRFPVVSLCQYDVRAFSGRAVLAALQCHEDTFHYPLSRFL